MTIKNYDEGTSSMVSLVRSWSNRDSQALPLGIIKDGLRYAADTAYRELEIPPLEETTFFVLQGAANNAAFTNAGATFKGVLLTGAAAVNSTAQATLPIPSDLVTYIFIRKVGTATLDSSGNYEAAGSYLKFTADTASQATVFNVKTDLRTFYDQTAMKNSDHYWTRHGADTLLSGPSLAENSVIQLHYRKRLSAMYARYTPIIWGYDNKILEIKPTTVIVDGVSGSPSPELELVLYFPTNTTATQVTADMALAVPILAPKAATATGFTTPHTLRGVLAPNWLRDENERIALFGALVHCFDYLGDMEMYQRYQDKFNSTIIEVNQEDKNRAASGGNVQVNFNSSLI
jgi:hypothetical protein